MRLYPDEVRKFTLIILYMVTTARDFENKHNPQYDMDKSV